MPKEFKYLFNNWEDEILNITHEAIECAIASAYLTSDGVDFLSKIAKRLAKFSTENPKTLIKVVLSDRFAPTKKEQLQILERIAKLPGVEARIYCGKEFQHRKNYIFRTNDEIRVVVGSVNVTSAGFFNNLEIATLSIHDEKELEVIRVVSEFESMWMKSNSLKDYMGVVKMNDEIPRFSVGENVRYISTGKIGTVNRVIEGSRSYSYKVTIEGKTRTIADRFLEPFFDEEDSLFDNFINGNFGDYDDFRLFQTWFRLSRPLENNLYSYLGSKTIFNPHQFKPLLRFLSPSSDERLFIADEVGVGKTIETGIILTEMMARGKLDNRTPILIICPNSLGPKWVKEMKERFRLDFHLHNGKTLRHSITTAIQEGTIPQRYIFSIVALQLIRREEKLALLEELDARRELPPFGLVVVDEAHHMRNPETDSSKLGNLLSTMTEMMLMLSATPLNLNNEDLYNQMHILNPLLFPDNDTFETLQSPVIILNKIRRLISKNTPESRKEINSKYDELRKNTLGSVIASHPGIKEFVNRLKDNTFFSLEEVVKYEKLFVSLSPLYYSFTRSRKREALEHQVHREVWEVPISFSDREMKFHNEVLEAIENYYLLKGGDPGVLQLITNTHRRMISSCIPAMKDYLQWCIEENKLKLMDESKLSETEDDSDFSSTELNNELKSEFLRLLQEAKDIETIDSKFENFLHLIKKTLSNPEIPQIIVFSFFVRTLEYLKRRLEACGYSVGMIHGKIPVIGNGKELDRYNIMEDFKKGKYQILLSSEVGGEGLDFQYCNAIVNYDLPYNPMRVEQRIGRVDRFGQKSDKIIVANLFIKDTVDEEIYDRLYRRISLVEDGVGELEPILGQEIADFQSQIISGKLTKEQKEELTRRLEESIASAKLEMEDFEKHRSELLGDDYLAKPINNLSSGNFISPDDGIQLTQQFLSDRDGCSYSQTGNNLGGIVLSDNVVSSLKQFLMRPKNEDGYGYLQTLLTPNKGIKVVFYGSIADEYPNHLFLPPTGYWTRFLTYQLQLERKIPKTFKFGARSSDIGLQKGRYLVFLFEVRLEGIRKEIEFLGVPIDVASNIVIETKIEHLAKNLANLNSFAIDTLPEDIDPNFFLDIVREYFEIVLEDKRKKASEENRYKVDSRITALKKSSEIKIMNLEQQIEKHIENRKYEGKEPDEIYIRLTTARIEKERGRLETKIRELEKRQEFSLDYTLEGIVYLEVGE
ncbi:MAG: DEAD/DEAH box helicase family protein [Desulfobacula sp.]|nr:DEAD/DEAH box helicase family protein [Desulfobacula sp.]